MRGVGAEITELLPSLTTFPIVDDELVREVNVLFMFMYKRYVLFINL